MKYSAAKKKEGEVGQGAEEYRISLNSYRPLTREEREEQEAERREKIKQLEGELETARKELRGLVRNRAALAVGRGAGAGAEREGEENEEGEGGNSYEELAYEILDKNDDIALLDKQLFDARYALHAVMAERRIPRTALFIDDSRIDTNVPIVLTMIKRPFTLQQMYVRVQEGGMEAGIRKKKRAGTVTAAPAMEVVRVRVVKPSIEGINGFLNPWFPAMIQYKGKGYPHAYKAAMQSVAAELGDAAEVARIEVATTPEEMTYRRNERIAAESYNRVLSKILLDTTREKFRQNPELGVRLLQTGTERIVIVPPVDPLDTVLGTGLDIKSPDIKDPTKWTGQNRLGFYIEQVRNELQTASAEKKSAAAAVMEAVIDTAGAAGGAGAGAAAAIAATTGAVVDAAGDAFAVAFDAIGDVLGVGEEEAPAAAPAAAAPVAVAEEEEAEEEEEVIAE